MQYNKLFFIKFSRLKRNANSVPEGRKWRCL